jgi:NADH-quinone oxidoreductase subunit M
MYNHEINIIGLWIVVYIIEKQFKTRKISELGGLASKAPVLTAMLVIITLANIALPLTNAFIGEFLMFSGIYSSKATVYNVVFTVTAAMTIILSAVYMLNIVCVYSMDHPIMTECAWMHALMKICTGSSWY